MSGKLMGQAFDLALTRSELIVLLALADHARDNGTGARPGIARLAWKTGTSKRQVERALNTLRQRGVIRRICGGGHGRATEYQILIAAGTPKPPFGQSSDIMADVPFCSSDIMAEESLNHPPFEAQSSAISAQSSAIAMAHQPLTVKNRRAHIDSIDQGVPSGFRPLRSKRESMGPRNRSLMQESIVYGENWIAIGNVPSPARPPL
jgi:hypothetical protein